MFQLINEGGLCEDTLSLTPPSESCIFQPCKNNCKGGIIILVLHHKLSYSSDFTNYVNEPVVLTIM